ncbi:cGMP-dependent 3',5'-cyclic phosphodiesterase isoform X2 [Parasteatoda tepidariorum]|uniref:cGMP-dependent 3',5'-cyclic phosphodiesterase isoform X2 n=3 Tax=Parasteatoda tepidariorum TaxID=114398 RepID=UPI001C72022F|nr:cGMP-dependent 3',5'-cyclic phosphodiesterase isoform X2 [Parasteatoda tepidariorum]
MTCLFGRCKKYVLADNDEKPTASHRMNSPYKMSNFPDSSDILKLCECLYANSSLLFQQEVNKMLMKKTSAEESFILFLSEDHQELACEVIGKRVLPEEIIINVENSAFAEVLEKKTDVIMNKAKLFNLGNNNNLNIQVHSYMCVPLFTSSLEEKVSSILCLINKNSFTVEDLDAVKSCSKYIAPLLYRLRKCEDERKIRKKSQCLLQVIKTLLIQIDNVNLLLKEVMTEAKKITGAERCSLFLLDKEENELVAKVFDGNDAEDPNQNPKDICMPAHEGIAGHVAMSGEILNIGDAYQHPLFYRKMDDLTGFKTRNILCFPIKDDSGVIGVAELCNKINGNHFTQFDEEIASTFSVYCAICIMHSLMWKKVRDAQSRSRLSNGLIMQAKVTEEDILKITSEMAERNFINEEFQKFSYIPRLLTDSEAANATLGMFADLEFSKFWRLRKTTLIRFIVTVKQGYRDPPYHNWKHGFSVAHFSYLLLKNLKLMGNQISPLEGLALYVACLCHDLDHRGTTSSFQVTSKSVLAALYSSEGSVLERHHFAQTMAILHADGCNIFENLSEEDYKKCLDFVREIILATDLAHHFRIIKGIKKVLEDGYDASNPEHHRILLCLMVTSCDLSDQTKDWINTKEIAKLIYREFFSQGDLEKAMGVKPNEMMDRERAQIPMLQISFLEQVVLPVYKLLSGFFPDLKQLVDVILLHQRQWEKVDIVFTENLSGSNKSPLDFLEDPRVDAAACAL